LSVHQLVEQDGISAAEQYQTVTANQRQIYNTKYNKQFITYTMSVSWQNREAWAGTRQMVEHGKS